jgi:hypothetical protein
MINANQRCSTAKMLQLLTIITNTTDYYPVVYLVRSEISRDILVYERSIEFLVYLDQFDSLTSLYCKRFCRFQQGSSNIAIEGST